MKVEQPQIYGHNPLVGGDLRLLHDHTPFGQQEQRGNRPRCTSLKGLPGC